MLFASLAKLAPLVPPRPLGPTPAAIYTGPNGARLNPLNSSDAVRIHTLLRKLGLYKGHNDALWSGASRTALRQFKQRAGLPADEGWDLLPMGQQFTLKAAIGRPGVSRAKSPAA